VEEGIKMLGITETHSSTQSRSLHTTVDSVVVSVSATQYDQAPWGKPQCYVGASRAFTEDEWRAILNAVTTLFEAYAARFPEGA
jgi:hypothetical protein